ncbi:hypothetical protein ACET3Z_025586 [Daucus carota]
MVVPDSLSGGRGDDVYVEDGCGNEMSGIVNEEEGSKDGDVMLHKINDGGNRTAEVTCGNSQISREAAKTIIRLRLSTKSHLRSISKIRSNQIKSSKINER